MARKSKTENPTDQITAALDTPVNLEWSTTAEKLNIPVPEFQERVAAKLNDSTVFAWENLPCEHEPLVDAIARDLESEASVRRFDAPVEPTAQLPQVADIPELPDDSQLEKTDGHSNTDS